MNPWYRQAAYESVRREMQQAAHESALREMEQAAHDAARREMQHAAAEASRREMQQVAHESARQMQQVVHEPARQMQQQCAVTAATPQAGYKEVICAQCGMVTLATHDDGYAFNNCQNCVKDFGKTIPPFTCQFHHCAEQFSTLASRKSHVKEHIAKPTHKCDVEGCGQSFYLSRNFDEHLWNHCRKPSICEYNGCNQTFADQLLLAKHNKVHNGGRMMCTWRNCGVSFTSVGSLKEHLVAHSRSLKSNIGSDFMCRLCDRVFTNKTGYTKHMVLHDRQRMDDPGSELAFNCEVPGCPGRFSLEADYMNHTLEHYILVPSICPTCNLSFKSQVALAKHSKGCGGNKAYVCPWEECETDFTNFIILKKHLLVHHLRKPEVACQRGFHCDMCELTFGTEKNLMSHRNSHGEETMSICPECGKEFPKNQLKQHMLIHMEGDSHICSQCGVGFAAASGLDYHMKSHHQLASLPYKCEYCDKDYNSKSDLHRHIAIHTKEKKYPCDQCGLKFGTKSGLKGHIKGKHGGRRYRCNMKGCDKVFTTSQSLRAHIAEGEVTICQVCKKSYINPYGHKCSGVPPPAPRPRKRKIVQDDSDDEAAFDPPSSPEEPSSSGSSRCCAPNGTCIYHSGTIQRRKRGRPRRIRPEDVLENPRIVHRDMIRRRKQAQGMSLNAMSQQAQKQREATQQAERSRRAMARNTLRNDAPQESDQEMSHDTDGQQQPGTSQQNTEQYPEFSQDTMQQDMSQNPEMSHHTVQQQEMSRNPEMSQHPMQQETVQQQEMEQYPGMSQHHTTPQDTIQPHNMSQHQGMSQDALQHSGMSQDMMPQDGLQPLNMSQYQQ